MNVAQETLGFRRQGLSPCLSLLMSAFALPIAPACLSTHLHSPRERSSTTPSNPLIALPSPKPKFGALRSRSRHQGVKPPIEVTGPSPNSSRDERSSHQRNTSKDLNGPVTSNAMTVGTERNQVDCLRSAASVIGLSPVTSSAQDDSISELLRFL